VLWIVAVLLDKPKHNFFNYDGLCFGGGRPLWGICSFRGSGRRSQPEAEWNANVHSFTKSKCGCPESIPGLEMILRFPARGKPLRRLERETFDRTVRPRGASSCPLRRCAPSPCIPCACLCSNYYMPPVLDAGWGVARHCGLGAVGPVKCKTQSRVVVTRCRWMI
jgi:hypothetical protein